MIVCGHRCLKALNNSGRYVCRIGMYLTKPKEPLLRSCKKSVKRRAFCVIIPGFCDRPTRDASGGFLLKRISKAFVPTFLHTELQCGALL